MKNANAFKAVAIAHMGWNMRVKNKNAAGFNQKRYNSCL